VSQSKLAIQVFTVREFTQTPQGMAESLRKLREIGYTAVETGVGSVEQAKEFAEIAEGEGLTVCGSHPGILRFKDEVESVIEETKILKCTEVISPYVPNDYWSAEGYAEFARILTEAGRRLAEEGLTLSHHNHSIEFQSFDGRTGMDILYAESDPACVFAEIDTYWVQYGGADPADWIRRLAGRQHLVHLKDMAIQERDPVFAPVGEGNLNWPAILDACRQADVQWYVVEQDVCLRDPFDCAASSYRFLREMGIE